MNVISLKKNIEKNTAEMKKLRGNIFNSLLKQTPFSYLKWLLTN